MTAYRNPWLSLAADLVRLGLEAQDVIGKRLIKAAWGDFDPRDEGVRMIAEKALATWEAAFVVTQSVIAGQGHLAGARALALLRRRVRANQRRLRPRSAVAS
ncbi:MAG: hypothetical protein ACREEB_13240 [Caulobacteraceae bacterium]